MEYIKNLENKYKNWIGYIYGVIAIFCLSTISIGSKSIKHLSSSESNIYRFIIVYVITYKVVNKSIGNESF